MACALLLSVRVKCARLQATAGGKASGYNTLLALKVGDVEGVTRVLSGATPAWAQEFFFNVNSPLEVLDADLQSKGWFSKDTLGHCRIHLFDVPFEEQPGEGQWYELIQTTDHGDEITGHQVLLDLHFDIEPGVVPKDAARDWKWRYVQEGGTEPVDLDGDSSAEQSGDLEGDEDDEGDYEYSDASGEGSYDGEDGEEDVEGEQYEYSEEQEEGEELEEGEEYDLEDSAEGLEEGEGYDDEDAEGDRPDGGDQRLHDQLYGKPYGDGYEGDGYEGDGYEGNEGDWASAEASIAASAVSSVAEVAGYHGGTENEGYGGDEEYDEGEMMEMPTGRRRIQPTRSLTRKVEGFRNKRESNRALSLTRPRIIEPGSLDSDWAEGSVCHSGDEEERQHPAAAAAAARTASLKPTGKQSKRKLGSRRAPKQPAPSAGGKFSPTLDSDGGEPLLRDRSDAVSAGTPQSYRSSHGGSIATISPPQSSHEDEFGSPGASLRLPPQASGIDRLSVSDVNIEVDNYAVQQLEEDGDGTTAQISRRWNRSSNATFDKASTLQRHSTNVTEQREYANMFQFQTAPAPALDKRRSFVTKNPNAQAAAVKRRIALLARRNVLLCNEQLQIHVYNKTVQALLYPLSDNKEHEVELVTFHKPVYCYECGSLLWGLARQGMKCTACGIKCHRRCLELLNADCLQRAAERYAKQGDVDKNRHFKRIMDEKMSRRQRDSAEVFDFIRQVFGVPKQQHAEVMANAKQSILEGLSVWSAKVKVTVIEAQGLTAKDKATATSDPYVTVQVGSKKLKTAVVRQNLNPMWNEAFEFECQESSDRIKVRVWDEDRDLKAAIFNALTKEPDDFLGQTIIEVYSLSGEMDVWYTLDRRSDRSAVSGAIHLRISVEVEGEEKKAPFHMQYTSLHETTFDHLDQFDPKQMMSFTQAPDRSILFFKKPAQDIIQEFALRYGIENIYQIMTHFSCLSMRYATSGVPLTLSRLLVLINGYFRDHVSATQTADGTTKTGKEQGRFLASNFKKEKFVEVLERLEDYLVYDLKAYRDVYPVDQEEKLDELKSAIDLLTSIMFFRQKVLNIGSAFRAKELVVECIEASMISTFHQLREENITLVAQGGKTAEEMVATETASASVLAKKAQVDESKIPDIKEATPLTYLFRLIEDIGELIQQDRDVYSKYISQFRDVNLGDMSAITLWAMLVEDLQVTLRSPAIVQTCQTPAFINLMFKVKWFFDRYVAKADPESQSENCKVMHRLFAPFVRSWLMETIDKFDGILKNALAKDEEENFKAMSDHNVYSWSVVDIFTAMTECHNVLQSTGCTDEELQDGYDQLYASLVVRVLTKYMAFLKNIFASRVPEPLESCILFNNTEQLRLRLEKLYKKMGGELIEETAAGNALNDLQSVLKQQQDGLCALMAKGLEAMIGESLESLPARLSKIKAGGNAPASENEAHALIEPVFEVLEKRIGMLVEKCNKNIVRKILKEMYRIILTNLLRKVVLPPLKAVRDPKRDHNAMDLTPRQYITLEKCVEGIQEFFYVESRGLKHNYMKTCAERRRIDDALAMYTLSTELLIGNFVEQEREQDKIGVEDPLGEINLQVDSFIAKGERKVTVKVVSASRLIWPTTLAATGMFRPFVEVTLFGPGLLGVRRRHETKSKTKYPPIYNEVFSFSVSREYTIDGYEFHFAVRDYCFGRQKPLVGVTVLPLRAVQQAGDSLVARLSIGQSLWFSEVGEDILSVLAQRPDDEVASEFVSLKLETRTVEIP